MNNVVILLNGDYPSHGIPLFVLNKSDYIICCDGAVNQLEKFGLSPYLIIGDLDSIKVSLKEKYKDKIIGIKRQTDTDLEKALKYCIENNIDDVKILGIAGKRDDQYLSNIFLGFEYSQKINIEMYSDFGSFHFVKKEQTFESYKGQKISIFSKSEEAEIKTKNLKYHLNKESIPYLYSGVSNQSLSSRFSLEVTGDSVMIYLLYRN